MFGSVDHRFESEIVDPDNYNDALDPDVKTDYLSCLMHRLPTLPASGDVQGFSHMYTVNQDDVHPVIGAAPGMENYLLCTGFSGHGFKLAPAVGSLVEQQILGARKSSDSDGSDCSSSSSSSSSGSLGETSIPLDFMSSTRSPLE